MTQNSFLGRVLGSGPIHMVLLLLQICPLVAQAVVIGADTRRPLSWWEVQTYAVGRVGFESRPLWTTGTVVYQSHLVVTNAHGIYDCLSGKPLGPFQDLKFEVFNPDSGTKVSYSVRGVHAESRKTCAVRKDARTPFDSNSGEDMDKAILVLDRPVAALTPVAIPAPGVTTAMILSEGSARLVMPAFHSDLNGGLQPRLSPFVLSRFPQGVGYSYILERLTGVFMHSADGVGISSGASLQVRRGRRQVLVGLNVREVALEGWSPSTGYPPFSDRYFNMGVVADGFIYDRLRLLKDPQRETWELLPAGAIPSEK